MFPTARRALWMLIAVSLGLRLFWAAILPPGNDEAYHYLFAVNPDWSYFDHPPMTMLLELAGLSVFGGQVTILALRLFFVLMFAGSTYVLYRWTARWYGDWAGFYAALALNVTAYYTAAAGAFALPDGPLLFFSLLTLWRLSEALVAPAGREAQGEPLKTEIMLWVWVGLSWAGALLSKYHAVFLPAGAVLYIVITPRARRCLLTPGPYVASVLGLCGFLPVLIWNLENDWASFAFQGSRAVGVEFQYRYLLEAIGGQMLYLLPWMWLTLVVVLVRLLRRFTQLGGIDRLLLCQSVVPLGFFLAVSCVQKTLPHWSLIGFVPLYPLVGVLWHELRQRAPAKMRLALQAQIGAVLLIAAGFAVQTLFGVIPLKTDPTLEMKDWTPIVEKLREHHLLGRDNTFFFTRSWFESGHLAFAMHNDSPVACYDVDARGFAFWSKPADWLGRDGILLSHGDNPYEPQNFRGYFRHIELIEEFPVVRNGRPVEGRTIRIFRCIDQKQAFPYRARPSMKTVLARGPVNQ